MLAPGRLAIVVSAELRPFVVAPSIDTTICCKAGNGVSATTQIVRPSIIVVNGIATKLVMTKYIGKLLKYIADSGATAVCAATEIITICHIHRQNRLRGISVVNAVSFMRLFIANIAATATNDIWKPMSVMLNGLIASIVAAAVAKAFVDIAPCCRSMQMLIMLIIIAERTTLGPIPTSAAYVHIVVIIMACVRTLRFRRAINIYVRIEYIMPR